MSEPGAALGLTDLRLGMLARGFHPVPVLRFDANDKDAGKRPTMVGWETVCAVADEAEIRRWSVDHGQRNCSNTGLLCGHVIGLDIDVPDYALACRINALADAMLPPTPLIRIGKSPKSLRAFRAEHVPHHKASTPTLFLPDGTKVQIEALGKGNHFVSFGTHPDTKLPYTWPQQSPLDVRFEDLPVLPDATLRAFLTAAEAGMRAAGGRTEAEIKDAAEGKTNPATSSAAQKKPRPARSNDFPPPTYGDVEDALAAVPNRHDWAGWVKIGAAIYDALADDGEDLFTAWSEQSSRNDPDATRRKWKSFSRSKMNISDSTLFWEARQNGWKPQWERERGEAAAAPARKTANGAAPPVDAPGDGPAHPGDVPPLGEDDPPPPGWRPVAPEEVFEPGRDFRMNQTTGVSEVYEPPGALPPPAPETAPGPQDEPSTEDPPVGPQPKRRRVRGEIDDTSPAAGPIIRVVAGKLHITTTTAEDALIASGLPIYQRGDGLVQPVVREVRASHGRTTLAAGLGEMNACSLVDVMCATAKYERYDARSKDWVRINPPAQIAQTLLSRQGKWRFPVVAGIITTPTLRPDGSLLTAPGYDPATRLYHVADPSLRLHPDVAAPSRDLAERALKVLETLLREFSFVSDVAKAVALSGIITPVVRGAMSVAPLHAVNAHAASSGKSFLVDLISLISTGRICPVASAAPDEAETEKRIAGLLLDGYPIVSIDNCNGELGGDLLCQAIERPLIRIRRLGGSDIFEIESTVTLFATGNNLRVRGDMVRRSLVAKLDPQMERPELRKFQYDPVAAILADRGRYVSACLMIVRAYILAGSPGKLDPIASFGGWSDLVRSALVWLGCSDPALSMEAAREDDPELGELREMMGVWYNAFGMDATTCKAAIAASMEKVAKPNAAGEVSPYAPKTEDRHPELQQMLQQIAGRGGIVNATRLGLWLLAKEGRIVGKFRFKRDGLTHGSARWRLQTAD